MTVQKTPSAQPAINSALPKAPCKELRVGIDTVYTQLQVAEYPQRRQGAGERRQVGGAGAGLE